MKVIDKSMNQSNAFFQQIIVHKAVLYALQINVSPAKSDIPHNLGLHVSIAHICLLEILKENV
jgi:hypothetical protein